MPEFKTEIDVQKWHLQNPSNLKSIRFGRVTTDGGGYARANFAGVMPDTDYIVLLSVAASPWSCVASYGERELTGFDVYTRDSRNGVAYPGIEVSWYIRDLT